MLTCGLKLTHDGAVALIDDNRLVFSVEMEKLDNNKRHSDIPDTSLIERVLNEFGYQVADIGQWVVDGWDGSTPGRLTITNRGRTLDLPVGTYRESAAAPYLFSPAATGTVSIGEAAREYVSYSHAAAHVSSAYCTSPFAARGEPSLVLIWDGGMFPMLYLVDPASGVTNFGPLFPLIGHAYATAAHHFGPYKREQQSAHVDDLSVAGKLMAYIALGKSQEWITAILGMTFHELFDGDSDEAAEYRRNVGGYGSLSEPSMPPLHRFYRTVADRLDGSDYASDDVLASVHTFLGELLSERLADRVRQRQGDVPRSLCLAGGCALNIKWNSALRDLPLFGEVWIPPFPNDAGSALGAAALGMMARSGIGALSWHTRLGPVLGPAVLTDGWRSSPCGPNELAAVLHQTGRPVIVLDGRAELGPRALGGRSIIAAPTAAAMKDELNQIKGREPYRPVAPICLAEAAPEIFDPGTPDPYMLFEHRVRPEWARRIPAVVHLDGTARLQTVSPADEPLLAAILTEYHRLSGIPVLCNTSANRQGCGFFPDVASAMAWGRVDRIWSDNVLYQRSAPS